MNLKKYKVKKDSREQKGWWFEENDRCLGTMVTTIETGDYTLEGFENVLCIERKGTVGEFANNITDPRFKDELIRMDSFKYGFLILEFSMHDILNFPKGSGIPSNKWDRLKITPKFLLRKLMEFEFEHKIKIILADYYGQKVAESIFKRVIDGV